MTVSTFLTAYIWHWFNISIWASSLALLGPSKNYKQITFKLNACVFKTRLSVRRHTLRDFSKSSLRKALSREYLLVELRTNATCLRHQIQITTKVVIAFKYVFYQREIIFWVLAQWILAWKFLASCIVRSNKHPIKSYVPNQWIFHRITISNLWSQKAVKY